MNAICGAGQDTWNLHHKFNSQGPALRILGPRVAIPNSNGRVSRVPAPRVPVLKVSGSRSPGSQVLILDYAHLYYRFTLYLIVTSYLNVAGF